MWDEVCSPKMQWWSLLALADLYVINRPHTLSLRAARGSSAPGESKARVRARAGCAAVHLQIMASGGDALACASGAGQPVSEAKGPPPPVTFPTLEGSVTLVTTPGRSDQTVPAQ